MAHNKSRARRRSRLPRLLVPVLAALTVVVAAGVGYYRYQSSTSAEEYLAKASNFYDQKRYRAAVIELKNALKADPESLEARWLLAQAYINVGDGLSASKELEAAKALDKNDPAIDRAILKALLLQGSYAEVLGQLATQADQTVDAEYLLIRGQAELGLGQHEKSKGSFTRVLELTPDNIHARRGLSASTLGLKETDEAERQLTLALASAPEDVETWVLKGELELSRNAFDKAAAAYEEALKREPAHLLARIALARVLLLSNEPAAALEHINFLKEANPHNPVGNYLFALASRQNNDDAATRTALLQVLKVSPNHPASLLLMGSMHYSNDEWEQAGELLSRYVSLRPDDSRGAKLLGAVHLKQKNYERAVEILQNIAPHAPEDAQLMALLGAAHMAEGHFDKAHEFMQKAAELQPQAPAIRAQLAVSHLFAGDTAESLKELEAAVELDPKFSRADFLLVILHLKEQRFEEALRAAGRLQQSQPSNPVPVNLMGAAREGLGDIEAARAEYERAVSLQPDYSTAQLNLARLDIASNDLEAAKHRYDTVLEFHANNLHALLALARVAESRGDRAEAVRLLERARAAHPAARMPRLVLGRHYLSVGDVAAALQVASEAQALSPRHPEILLLAGRANIAAGDHAGAVISLESLVELVPDNARHQYYLGVALANSNKREAGRAAFERSLAIDPNFLAANSALGRLSLSEGNVDEALEVAAALEESYPDKAGGFLLRGDALLLSKNLEAAETAYHAAQERRPNRRTLMKIAAVQRAMGAPERAIATFAQWLTEKPQDQVVRMSLASLHHATGNKDDAAKLYEQAIKANPTDVIALNNLAWIYHERKDSRALDLALQAYDLLPGQAEIIDTYGWFLIESGHVEQGLQLLDRAVEGAPDNASIRYHRAAGLARAGDKQAARAELSAILSSEQTFSLREEAESLLEELQ